MLEKEFAFSIDNLRPLGIVTWFAMYDDDLETCRITEAIRAIQADRDFWLDFNIELDKILLELELCPRRSDGYLGNIDPSLPPQQLQKRILEVEQRLDLAGYIDGAISALKRSGYETWRNPVGHIAIAPKNRQSLKKDYLG